MNPIQMLISFVLFVVQRAPKIANEVRELLKEFGDKKGIPPGELQPALQDTLSPRVAEVDREVDAYIGNLYGKKD